ncbi:acyl-CoA thioesterase [Alicyclobacillus sacchari]|uniref:acyl-CoA thioesterase n=2 Tax=Alicyclobacillus sacchari TaxID=392010 RepID=UPI0024E16135|nr:thioesterase family protein [Alicyclobacillus sacchari]
MKQSDHSLSASDMLTLSQPVAMYADDLVEWGSLHMGITQITTTVRCTEIDVNGHVNNAKYVEYYEWGREDWYEQHQLPYETLYHMGVITVVARAEIDYRQPAHQNEQLLITTWLSEVGRTSFRMRQRITGTNGYLVSEAQFVIVTVDPQTRRPVPVPEAISKHRS